MPDDRLISTPELAEASGAYEHQLRYWIDHHILVPAKGARGQGTRHGFTTEHIIEATQLVELTKAGLSSRQLFRLATVQRESLAGLSAHERIVRRFELYITSVVTLASVFGKGDSFNDWLTRQQNQLALMRAELFPSRVAARRRSPRRQTRSLLQLFIAANKPQQDTATPLAG